MAEKFDIKEKIDEIVDKIKADPKMLEQFKSEPVKVIEKLVGIDLPDEKLQPLVNGIKAKLAAADIGGALGALKKLF
ncbi:MAG: hypothetical protein E7334_08015 [Clostridiales bacterium]|nr:hypothetical protein [Clostridiales bacterium]MBQ2817091.1 hypothetical protein [Clostridia bacterium]MBQ4637426.1 hypothetical protein [Clostridia bacterium]